MILRNGRVFISHMAKTRGTSPRCSVDSPSGRSTAGPSIQPGDSDTQLSPKTLEEIGRRDVFLRICTPAAAESARMHLEAAALRAKAQEDQERGYHQQARHHRSGDGPHLTPDPADTGYLTIDTTNRPMNDWLVVVYNETGKMQATRAMGRRTMTVVVTVCVVGAFIVVLAILVFFVLFQGVFRIY